MRLSPAQVGMFSLLGHRLPMGAPEGWTLADRVRHGREFLAEVAEANLGYDPAAWHEHLLATTAGGYTWSNAHLGMPKRIAEAVADPAWREAVETLKAAER